MQVCVRPPSDLAAIESRFAECPPGKTCETLGRMARTVVKYVMTVLFAVLSAQVVAPSAPAEPTSEIVWSARTGQRIPQHVVDP